MERPEWSRTIRPSTLRKAGSSSLVELGRRRTSTPSHKLLKIRCMPGAICAPSMKPRRACSRRGMCSSVEARIGMDPVGIGILTGPRTDLFPAMAFGTVHLAGRSIRPGSCTRHPDGMGAASAGMKVMASPQSEDMGTRAAVRSARADALLVPARIWAAECVVDLVAVATARSVFTNEVVDAFPRKLTERYK